MWCLGLWGHILSACNWLSSFKIFTELLRFLPRNRVWNQTLGTTCLSPWILLQNKITLTNFIYLYNAAIENANSWCSKPIFVGRCDVRSLFRIWWSSKKSDDTWLTQELILESVVWICRYVHAQQDRYVITTFTLILILID